MIYVGQAGWSIASAHAAAFPGEGTHLARYARTLPGVEINSSFYRPHKPATYARWAASVPTHFRFAVKVPRVITHEARLHDADDHLARFLDEAGELGDRLGPLLVQLPPSLALDVSEARDFFARLRRRFLGDVVCEPRHRTWLTDEGDALLRDAAVARVAADPAPAPGAERPGGACGLLYIRLHGSPRMYHSAYALPYLQDVAAQLLAADRRGHTAWCILDNTASGAALGDALTLARLAQSDRAYQASQLPWPVAPSGAHSASNP